MTKVNHFTEWLGPTMDWTIERYQAMIDAAVFDEDERFELLYGKIIPMSPIGRFHAACVRKLNRLITSRLLEIYTCSQEQPIQLADNSQPEPDYVIATYREDAYVNGHPEPKDIKLLIEVADRTLSVFYEPNLPASTGGEASISANKGLYTLSDSLIKQRYWSEEKALVKMAGVGYRLAKFALLDVQQDFMLALIQHEVFGHGARYREFELETTNYDLNLLPPYGVGGGSASYQPNGRLLSTEENLAIRFSGNEANSWLAGRMESRMLLARQIHYREASLYLIARNNLLFYTGTTYLLERAEDSGDIFNYVNIINSANPRAEGYTTKQLFNFNLITLANPLQWYAGWTLGVNYLLEGKNGSSTIPMIGRKWQYLPAFDLNLTPFGAEFIMDNYLLNNDRLFHLQLRYGEPTFHRFYGVGLGVFKVAVNERYQLNARLEGWHQPAFEMGGDEFRTIDAGLGGLAEINGAYFPLSGDLNHLGLYGRVGYKTTGYLRGEALDRGFLFGIGLAWRE